MSSYETVDQAIKNRMVEALKAAGPAGLTQAEVTVVEFEAMEDALRMLCDLRDEVLASFKKGARDET